MKKHIALACLLLAALFSHPAAAQVETETGQWQKLISQGNRLEITFPGIWEVRDTSDGVAVHHITDTSAIQVHIMRPKMPEDGQLPRLDSLAEAFKQDFLADFAPLTIFQILPFELPHREAYTVEGAVVEDGETYYLKAYLIAYDDLLLMAVAFVATEQDFQPQLTIADEVVRRARVLK